MSLIKQIQLLCIILANFLFFGGIIPFLISYADDASVGIGIILAIALVLVDIHIVRKEFSNV